ncbi:MAG: hypothetical protein Q9M36_14740 [Sulfurovum sp.]|nr:hypothetical protein [Sulfurovum sp.]
MDNYEILKIISELNEVHLELINICSGDKEKMKNSAIVLSQFKDIKKTIKEYLDKNIDKNIIKNVLLHRYSDV